MNIAKHMEAIVIVAAVALTGAAALASPAGGWHTGEVAANSIGKSATVIVSGKGLTATLTW